MNRKGYDVIIIGAGIAGVSVAYWLKKFNQKVLLVDKTSLLAGASGAAGAFLSPRLGKGGDLQRITNEAYLFALDFYSKTVPEGFFQKGLLRIPKDEEDAKKFEVFKEYLDLPFKWCKIDDFSFVNRVAMQKSALFFPSSAFVDVGLVASKLTESIDTKFGYEVKPVYKDGEWIVGEYVSKNIVIATGADKLPVDVPYIKIGRLFGERVDLKTSAKIPVTLHKKISVSANIGGIVRIGATHVRDDSRSADERIDQLIKDAIELAPDLKDHSLLKIYSGYRSSVNDHFPIVGAIANLNKSLSLKPFLKELKPESSKLPRVPGCYILGGFGGRGFVFAPLMGKFLAQKIVKGRDIDKSVSSDRYLLRFLKK